MAVRRFAEEQDPLLDIINRSYQGQLAGQMESGRQMADAQREHGQRMAEYAGAPYRAIEKGVQAYQGAQDRSLQRDQMELSKRVAEEQLAASTQQRDAFAEERGRKEAENQARGMGAEELAAGYTPQSGEDINAQFMTPAMRMEGERRTQVADEKRARDAQIAMLAQQGKLTGEQIAQLTQQREIGEAAALLGQQSPLGVPYANPEQAKNMTLASYSPTVRAQAEKQLASDRMMSQYFGKQMKLSDPDYGETRDVAAGAATRATRLSSLADDVATFEKGVGLTGTALSDQDLDDLKTKIAGQLTELGFGGVADQFLNTNVVDFTMRHGPEKPATIAKRGLRNALMKIKSDVEAEASVLSDPSLAPPSLQKAMMLIKNLEGRLGSSTMPQSLQNRIPASFNMQPSQNSRKSRT